MIPTVTKNTFSNYCDWAIKLNAGIFLIITLFSLISNFSCKFLGVV